MQGYWHEQAITPASGNGHPAWPGYLCLTTLTRSMRGTASSSGATMSHIKRSRAQGTPLGP